MESALEMVLEQAIRLTKANLELKDILECNSLSKFYSSLETKGFIYVQHIHCKNIEEFKESILNNVINMKFNGVEKKNYMNLQLMLWDIVELIGEYLMKKMLSLSKFFNNISFK
ncbi:hypothetical protein RFI_34710 [Reticulomyxa filosa]|uniref:Uncharacterized protein n=1 Tax=Reticulomyxa filosa TaxID=46433 RepID=X6LL70_RETFI|nr:hypothetical protein RFI_34710 [Reticulomyxa filosa]|eukprot:ETO02703.1 hypothetical protein RFI_34710 [Reticulomyxa filosa]